jgi:hypothetical protein
MCGVEGHSSPRFRHYGRMTACFGSFRRGLEQQLALVIHGAFLPFSFYFTTF